VVDRLLEGLQHGCLHAQVAGIHVFVVHLSPFRWKVRRDEARLLLAHIEPLLEAGHEVLVLGDFNALSPSDHALIEAQPEVLEKERANDAKHDHVTNLRDGALDFSVMEAFLDAALQDPALPFLEARGDTRRTFTTGIWTEEKTGPPNTGTRIDFILADPTLARAAQDAQIVRIGIVNRRSDHYPVLVDFARDVRP
jgi:exodeoxyribonuclease-3